jgi:type II secretory pathway component PulM
MKLSLDTMSARERRLVLICGVVAALVIILGVMIPLDRTVASARTRVGQKQADLAWMKRVAPVIAAAGPMQSGSTNESLLVVVDRSARESGLGPALAGSEPSGAGSLQVRLEKASFDAMIGWLSRISQQNGIRVDGATIDSAGGPGIVNASLVLHSR